MAREIWVVERAIGGDWNVWEKFPTYDQAVMWIEHTAAYKNLYRVVRYIPAEGHIHEEGE